MATTPPSTANNQQSSARRDFRDKPDLAEDVDRVVGLVQPNVRQPYAATRRVTRNEVLHVIPSLPLTLVYPRTPFESRFLFLGYERGRAGNGPTQPCSSRTVADREGAGDQASSYPVSQRCMIPCYLDDSYIFESIGGVRWRGP
jgi:hypothetical protein